MMLNTSVKEMMCLVVGVLCVRKSDSRITSSYGIISLRSNIQETAMKLLGIGICFAIMLGAILQIGHHLFIDINSALFVLGGATGFLVFKKNSGNHIKNFGQGAVYFGWVGTLIGLIAITGNRFMVWGDVEKMGPALAVAMLTILYGYTIKLATIALTED
jgi:flagellar motor component MotA